MTLLEADRAERYFDLGGRQSHALGPTSIAVKRGEFLSISGVSGSGKSTLLNLMSGLDRPSAGRVVYQGTDLFTLTEAELAATRNADFGFIFQTPHLLPDRTVLENVALPFLYGQRITAGKVRERCLELLDYVGLGNLAERYPATLSGGEMQRVVCARALAREPQVIFADEPTGSLDGENSSKVLDLLREQTLQQRTVIMVTHDLAAAAFADRQLTLEKYQGAVDASI
jgi:ABC-type lipoprotein export system ATPase subunit